MPVSIPSLPFPRGERGSSSRTFRITSWLILILVSLLGTVRATTNDYRKVCPPCVDIPPPSYTCAEQRRWGKCGEAFMTNICDRTCGRCTAACPDVTPPASTVISSVLTPSAPPTPLPTARACVSSPTVQAWLAQDPRFSLLNAFTQLPDNITSLPAPFGDAGWQGVVLAPTNRAWENLLLVLAAAPPDTHKVSALQSLLLTHSLPNGFETETTIVETPLGLRVSGAPSSGAEKVTRGDLRVPPEVVDTSLLGGQLRNSSTSASISSSSPSSSRILSTPVSSMTIDVTQAVHLCAGSTIFPVDQLLYPAPLSSLLAQPPGTVRPASACSRQSIVQILRGEPTLSRMTAWMDALPTGTPLARSLRDPRGNITLLAVPDNAWANATIESKSTRTQAAETDDTRQGQDDLEVIDVDFDVGRLVLPGVRRLSSFRAGDVLNAMRPGVEYLVSGITSSTTLSTTELQVGGVAWSKADTGSLCSVAVHILAGVPRDLRGGDGLIAGMVKETEPEPTTSPEVALPTPRPSPSPTFPPTPTLTSNTPLTTCSRVSQVLAQQPPLSEFLSWAQECGLDRVWDDISQPHTIFAVPNSALERALFDVVPDQSNPLAKKLRATFMAQHTVPDVAWARADLVPGTASPTVDKEWSVVVPDTTGGASVADPRALSLSSSSSLSIRLRLVPNKGQGGGGEGGGVTTDPTPGTTITDTEGSPLARDPRSRVTFVACGAYIHVLDRPLTSSGSALDPQVNKE